MKKHIARAEQGFKAWAKENSIDYDTYPHSVAGLKVLRVIVRLLTCILICLVVYGVIQLLIALCASSMSSTPATPMVSSQAAAGVSFDSVAAAVGVAIRWVLSTSLFIASTLGWIVAILAVVYAIITVMRWRCFERQCLVSDISAISLRARLLSITAIKRRIGDFNRAQSAKKNHALTFEEQSKLDAMKAMAKLRVYVNTRESLDSNSVERRYRIIITAPAVQSAFDQLIAQLKDFDAVATRAESGRVSFSAMTTSADRSQIQFSDSVVVNDSMADAPSQIVVEQLSQYAFPLSLFIDHTDEIAKKTAMATEWAERTGAALDTVFASTSKQSKRLSTSVGGTNALFTYELAKSFASEIGNTSSFEEMLDRVFKTRGSSASIEAGNFLITMALPKQFQLPIDVPSMYKTIFGESAGEEAPISADNKGVNRLITKAANPTHAVFGLKTNGEPFGMPLSKGPHWIIAGQTGSGKSVFANSLLVSMISHSDPRELKLVWVDPKKVEAGAYVGLPYCPIDPVTDMHDAYGLMLWLTKMMDDRYTYLEDVSVKNIEEFNDWVTAHPQEAAAKKYKRLPYWVCVIDEYADMVMQESKVEQPIVRIGQKARAAGIHLLIMTQRPSATVITPLLKANIPSRVCLKTADGTNSAIVLDETGGEKLKGYGDGLVKTGEGDLTRVQGPYISNDEIEKIFKHLRAKYASVKMKPIDYKQEVVDAGLCEWALPEGVLSIEDVPEKDRHVQQPSAFGRRSHL